MHDLPGYESNLKAHLNDRNWSTRALRTTETISPLTVTESVSILWKA